MGKLNSSQQNYAHPSKFQLLYPILKVVDGKVHEI
jgi:hypothetical protein